MFKLVVFSVVLALAAAIPNGVWSVGLSTPVASAWGAQLATGVVGSWAAPLAAPLAAPIAAVAAPIGASNYRGPLSLAPGQPANILAADGRPLDTLSVNLDRAVHYTAKAVEGNGHWLKKRSILASPLVATSLTAAPLAASWVASPPVAVAAAAPIATPLAAPIAAVVGPVGSSNYRGPLSLAPGQPANILAADGRPLDTLSVNLDRAVHYTAKAIEGTGHWLKKRSIVAAPLAAAPLATAPLVANSLTAPLAANWIAPAPVAVAAAAPWGLGVGARVGHLW